MISHINQGIVMQKHRFAIGVVILAFDLILFIYNPAYFSDMMSMSYQKAH